LGRERFLPRLCRGAAWLRFWRVAITDEEAAVSATDELLCNNAAYVAAFASGELPMPPGKQVAVLACMDAHLNVYDMLGLHEGDAHVIRNAGGVATDDASTPWSSPSACSAPARSSWSTTPTAAC
jgi:hypothetical protein